MQVSASGSASPLDGLRPAQTPRHSGSLTLAWTGDNGARASLGAHYVGAQFEDDLNRQLLMTHDWADSDELPMTQEFLATMLCVHRPSITVVARILQRANLILYSGGTITVVDRPGLEAAACECHGAVQRQYRKLLG